MATTLQNLRDRARAAADMTGSSFVSDSEANVWINQGLFELYDLVVSAYEDYFTSPAPTTLTIASGNIVSLPADFYKLRKLQYSASGTDGSYQPCKPFNLSDNFANGGADFYTAVWSNRRYRVMGDSLLIEPAASAPGSYLLHYVPAPTALVSNSDEIPSSLSKFGWDEYIVLYVAERMLNKEESPSSDVRNLRGEIAGRIAQMSGNRQADQAEQVADVGSRLNFWWG